jgi:hypothetical protein
VGVTGHGKPGAGPLGSSRRGQWRRVTSRSRSPYPAGNHGDSCSAPPRETAPRALQAGPFGREMAFSWAGLSRRPAKLPSPPGIDGEAFASWPMSAHSL